MGKLIDLTGKTFGRLTVLRQGKTSITPSGQRKIHWVCQCSCESHTVLEVQGASLRQGKTVSCGCKNHETPLHFKDLTGMRFGKLTVIERVNNVVYGKQTKVCWKCKCDCGNEVVVVGSSMKIGYTQSCGCYKVETSEKFLIPAEHKLNQYDLSGNYGIGFSNNSNSIFYFDLEDYDKIKDYCWDENASGYMVSHTKESRKTLLLHRFIMNIKEGCPADHINRNKRDNRKENLRPVTVQQNTINRNPQKNNKSGYIGVGYYNKKWRAYITLNRKMIHLGSFQDKEEAVRVRLEAELKYFSKDFAPQRHLFEQYNIK